MLVEAGSVDSTSSHTSQSCHYFHSPAVSALNFLDGMPTTVRVPTAMKRGQPFKGQTTMFMTLQAESELHPVPAVRRWFTPSLRTKALGLALLITTASTIAGAAAVWWIVSDQLMSYEKDKLATAAHSAIPRLNGILAMLREDTQALSNATSTRALAGVLTSMDTGSERGAAARTWRSQTSATVEALLAAKPNYRQVRIIGSDGSEFLRIGGNRSSPSEAAELRTGDSSSMWLSLTHAGVYLSPIERVTIGEDADPRYFIDAIEPIFNEANTLVSVVILRADLSNFFSDLSKWTVGDTMVSVLDHTGMVLWSSIPERQSPLVSARIEDEFPSFSRVFGSGFQNHMVSELKNVTGRMMAVGVQDFSSSKDKRHHDLRFVLSRPLSSIYHQALSGFPDVLAAVALVLLICLILALAFAMLLVTPIRDMISRLSVCTNDALPPALPTHRHDEIGTLAQVFNDLFRAAARRQHALESEARERDQAEVSARRTATQLQTIIGTMLDGLVVCDSRGQIILANPAIARIFGYPTDTLEGYPITCLLPQASHDTIDERLERPERWKHLLGVTRPLSARRCDGTTLPIDLTISTFMMDNGQYFSVMVRDQTEAREAQAALRRMAVAVENAADAIIIQDSNNVIVYVNQACQTLLDLPREVLIGKSPTELALGLDPPEYYRTISTELANGQTWRGSLTLRSGSGRTLKLDSAVSPVRDATGVLSVRVSVMRDVGERLDLEQQLLRAQKLEAIGQLAAGIAHEINTPTQFVSDNIQFLHDSFRDLSGLLEQVQNLSIDPSPGVESLIDTAAAIDISFLQEEIPKALVQSAEGCQRIATIVGAMKEFAHPGNDKCLVDLNRNIRSTITIATNEWKYVAEVHLDLEDGLQPVTCIPAMLNQVILNLVVNAAHAIDGVAGNDANGKGLITIATRTAGDHVVIRVTDTGTGIPPDIRDRIFDPFFTTKPVGKGTGQGLMIAHDIVVNKHGGSLTFESEMGKGTTFIIRIPLHQEPEPDSINGSAAEAANLAT